MTNTVDVDARKKLDTESVYKKKNIAELKACRGPWNNDSKTRRQRPTRI